MPSCKHCDNEVAWDAKFCPRCGKRDPAELPPSGDGTLGLGGLIAFVVVGGIAGMLAASFLYYMTHAIANNPGEPLPGLGTPPVIYTGLVVGAGAPVVYVLWHKEERRVLFSGLLTVAIWGGIILAIGLLLPVLHTVLRALLR